MYYQDCCWGCCSADFSSFMDMDLVIVCHKMTFVLVLLKYDHIIKVNWRKGITKIWKNFYFLILEMSIAK